MAAVTVFVDDAVLGDLPPLCAISGRPTDTTVVIRHRMGGLPAAAFLLLLLGPVGIAILLVLALAWRPQMLAVRLPYHEDVLRNYRRALIVQAGLIGSGFAALGLSIFFVNVSPGMVWVLVGVVCFAGAAVAGLAGKYRQPGIDLDASRRWVTLWRVHPDFAAAAQSRARSDSRESASARDLSGR